MRLYKNTKTMIYSFDGVTNFFDFDIWKSDFSDKIKRDVFLTVAVSAVLCTPKTAAVRSLTSHLTNHQSMMNNTCLALLRSKGELVSDVLQ